MYSAATNEIFATMQYTDPTYQGAGVVIAYNIKTGARRIVSGRCPDEATGYEMYGSGYKSKRSVGTQLFEDTTFLPEDHAFAMGPDGSFYPGFRNGIEGNGIVTISPDGKTCSALSRWNGTMGQSTRDLLFTGGGVQSYLGVAVNVVTGNRLVTGNRQADFLTAPGEMIESAPRWETGAHGAIDNANYQGYGALVMDPDNNNHLYLVTKWGLLKDEMFSGNRYVMSQ